MNRSETPLKGSEYKAIAPGLHIVRKKKSDAPAAVVNRPITLPTIYCLESIDKTLKRIDQRLAYLRDNPPVLHDH